MTTTNATNPAEILWAWDSKYTAEELAEALDSLRADWREACIQAELDHQRAIDNGLGCFSPDLPECPQAHHRGIIEGRAAKLRSERGKVSLADLMADMEAMNESCGL